MELYTLIHFYILIQNAVTEQGNYEKHTSVDELGDLNNEIHNEN